MFNERSHEMDNYTQNLLFKANPLSEDQLDWEESIRERTDRVLATCGISVGLPKVFEKFIIKTDKKTRRFKKVAAKVPLLYLLPIRFYPTQFDQDLSEKLKNVRSRLMPTPLKTVRITFGQHILSIKALPSSPLELKLNDYLMKLACGEPTGNFPHITLDHCNLHFHSSAWGKWEDKAKVVSKTGENYTETPLGYELQDYVRDQIEAVLDTIEKLA